MKKNDFRQKMLEMHKNDADIYKIKKKHNDLGTNSKISLITYNTNNELLIIKETDSNEPIQVIKTSKDNLDLSDDTKLTTESLNLNSNNFSVKEIEKILPTVDTIIKDTDDKLYGISFGKIKQIGVSDYIDDSVSVKDLNRWVEKAFNYDVVDKEFSNTAIVYNKFHYHDYHYNHKLRKNKLQVSDEFGDTELLVLSKEIMHTMQHGTEEEKYSIIFDRYSLNKNTRYRLLSTAQIVEYGAYITYFDGLNNRHGELIETMENGDKKFRVYHPSNVVKGINAVESNTYTYEFELICSPDNSLKIFKFLQKLDYCRVVENGTFANYYRSPIDLGLTYDVRGRILPATHYVSGTYVYSTDYARYRSVWDDEDRHIGNADYDTDVYWAARRVTCDKYNTVISTTLHEVEIDGSWNGGWNEGEDRWYSASDYVIARTPYHKL